MKIMNNKDKIKLTKREYDLLVILWKANKPLVASEFPQYDESLSVNTVQAYIKKLLKLQLVEVAEIVYSGTVLARSYRPTISRTEFDTKFYINTVGSDISASLFVDNFFSYEVNDEKARNELDKLEQIIKEHKERLNKKAE